jgi:hypothetical protein
MGESMVMTDTYESNEEELIVTETEVSIVALGTESDTSSTGDEGSGDDDVKWEGGGNQSGSGTSSDGDD